MSVKYSITKIARACGLTAVVCALVVSATPATAAPGQEQQASIDVLVVEWSGGDATDIGTSLIYRSEPIDGDGSGEGIIDSVQSNFPKFSSPSSLGFSLFVDRIRFNYGEIEGVFEAVETNENVKILSRQTTYVAEGDPKGGHIAGSQQVPYESTKTFGSTTAQITLFRNTGVTFDVKLEKIVDDYLVLLIAADVTERGKSVTVALDERSSSDGGVLGSSTAALKVPEFDTRRISTTVSVHDGDTLVLGGLINKTSTTDERTVPILGPAFKKLSTVPYIGKLGAIRYLFTSRKERESYRELIFFVTPRIKRGYRVFLQEDLEPDEADSEPSKKAEPDRKKSGTGEGKAVSEKPQTKKKSVAAENSEKPRSRKKSVAAENKETK